MLKYDYSIHFTIKNQTLAEIISKLCDWFNNQDIIDYLDNNTVLHHCFLPRPIIEQRKLSPDIVNFLDDISGNSQINWWNADKPLELNRHLMLQNLKRLNGIALFVGAISDGVAEELELVKLMNIDYILI